MKLHTFKFDIPFLAHYYYILVLSLPALCPRVEKIIKENLHFLLCNKYGQALAQEPPLMTHM